MISCVLVKLRESTLLFSSSGELSIGRTHIIQINKLTRITMAISWPSLFSGLDYWTGLLDSRKLPLEEKGTRLYRDSTPPYRKDVVI